ncbi:unnamed protein product [Microthlaspi erraticum]|uniref:Uncharacterized protein n=1 Tax=Microthlaspi erraticum TaxID=1685480 RepID=A0A6D2L1E1_9BRAS|nr:unnamed protein product [Microthlaspi erraticum]CAA7058572.1 unnamed protein product [Microthlaspi erraticum]
MDSESELISLISQLISLDNSTEGWVPASWLKFITQIISLLRSIDFDSELKPESELMSLTSQLISFFNSMDLDSQPQPLSELISLITQVVNSVDLEPDLVTPLVTKTLRLEPEPELISLMYQIFSIVISMSSKSGKLVPLVPSKTSLFPTGKVSFDGQLLVEDDDSYWQVGLFP